VVDFEEVSEENLTILDKNIRVTAKASAVGDDPGVGLITVRL
jgi:hypothetical protein